MKNIVLALIILAAPSVWAEKAPLVITAVNIATPLPTGLEIVGSPEVPKAEPKSVVEMTFTHPTVQPILDSASKIHQDKIDTAIAFGGAFYQEGNADINCQEHPTFFLTLDRAYCKMTVTKSFGWYADIDLAFVVEGYILKSAIPEGQFFLE